MKFKRKLTRQERDAAHIFAILGGRSKSDKKARAARKNGKLGGRPKSKI